MLDKLKPVHMWLAILLCMLLFLLTPESKGQQQQIELSAPPPPATQSVSAGIIGQQGNRTFFYWVVANYPIGSAVAAGPARVDSVPDTFSASNFVRIGWRAMSGATSYDVLRTNTNVLFASGSSCTCLLGNVTTNTFADQGGGLSAYTLSPAQDATAVIRLNNRDFSSARLTFTPDISQSVEGDVIETKEFIFAIDQNATPAPGFSSGASSFTATSVAGSNYILGTGSFPNGSDIEVFERFIISSGEAPVSMDAIIWSRTSSTTVAQQATFRVRGTCIGANSGLDPGLTGKTVGVNPVATANSTILTTIENLPIGGCTAGSMYLFGFSRLGTSDTLAAAIEVISVIFVVKRVS